VSGERPDGFYWVREDSVDIMVFVSNGDSHIMSTLPNVINTDRLEWGERIPDNGTLRAWREGDSFDGGNGRGWCVVCNEAQEGYPCLHKPRVVRHVLAELRAKRDPYAADGPDPANPLWGEPEKSKHFSQEAIDRGEFPSHISRSGPHYPEAATKLQASGLSMIPSEMLLAELARRLRGES